MSFEIYSELIGTQIYSLIKRIRIFLFMLMSTMGSAWACPDQQQMGDTFTLSGPELYSAKTFPVVAGGGNLLLSCSKLRGVAGENGHFMTKPDFSLDVSQMQKYELRVSVVSKCDSALLVNTPDNVWFYDDDSNGNMDALLTLNTVPDGWLDIWVGTYDGEYCNATLTLETF